MMNSPVLQPEAATALLHRRSIRRSFIDWSRHKGFEPAPHHRLIISEIEAFLASDDEVLLLFAPPGSAKSTYVSVLFPSWYLARYPHNSILFATHSVEFAERWGRRVRNDIALDGKTLGIELADDSQAAGRWALKSGGEYYAVGAGTGISGFRADLGLGDDFFGSREDAYSETVRKKRWEWYTDDFGHRLKPGAKRILMNTRWHEEDVAGKVLEQIEQGTVRGRVICIRAIAEADDVLGREPGEYLWDEPAGYNYGSFLRSRQRETSPMMWSALFQQRPAPEEGDYFKNAWLKSYNLAPPRSEMRVYGASDYAVTADGGDYTVHIVVGLDHQGRMYVLDLWRGQKDSAAWIEAWCALVREWKPLAWAEESGQIKAAVGPFLERRARELKAYTAREQFPSRHDKAIRAQSIRGRMSLEGLYLPDRAGWVPAFLAELLSFPTGKHDDQCLAEDAQVTMADGNRKPIGEVAVGDLVATPNGPEQVLAARVTNEAAKVCRVTFSDGRELVATGNHPVFVVNKGFVRLDALAIMDQITTDLETLPCSVDHQRLRLSSIGAIDIGGIRTERTGHTGATSSGQLRAADFFTAICGRMLSGRSRPITKSTIETATGTTIRSAILNASRHSNIAAAIRWLVSNWGIIVNISPQYGPRQRFGMQVQPGANGIVSTLKVLGRIALEYLGRANVAPKSFERLLPLPDFVVAAASSGFTERAQVHQCADVSLRQASLLRAFAASSGSSPNGRRSANIAPKPAVCVTGIEALSKTARVRNLTVARAHTFYANGILTHNCDALSLIGQLLDKVIYGQLPKKPEPRGDLSGYRDFRRDDIEDSIKVL